MAIIDDRNRTRRNLIKGNHTLQCSPQAVSANAQTARMCIFVYGISACTTSVHINKIRPGLRVPVGSCTLGLGRTYDRTHSLCTHACTHDPITVHAIVCRDRALSDVSLGLDLGFLGGPALPCLPVACHPIFHSSQVLTRSSLCALLPLSALLEARHAHRPCTVCTHAVAARACLTHSERETARHVLCVPKEIIRLASLARPRYCGRATILRVGEPHGRLGTEARADRIYRDERVALRRANGAPPAARV
jgi:hypothetical protein